MVRFSDPKPERETGGQHVATSSSVLLAAYASPATAAPAAITLSTFELGQQSQATKETMRKLLKTRVLHLLVCLLPLRVRAFVITTTADRILTWRGGSSVGVPAAAAAEEARAPAGEAMIGRGPQEAVHPFVPDLLKGRKALVTGGNRGIGEAITVALIKAGAQVCVMAGNKE